MISLHGVTIAKPHARIAIVTSSDIAKIKILTVFLNRGKMHT